MLPALLILIIAAIVNDATAAASNNEKALETEDLEDKFNFLGPRSLIKSHKILDSVIDKNDVTGQNNTCGRDLAILDQALIRRETWALKMLDASSKIPSGILEGNIVDLGMYDECMGIKNKSMGVEIRGHHCMYSFPMTSSNFTLLVNPTLSVCMPSSCNGSDIVRLLNGMISTSNRFKDPGTTVEWAACTTLDKEVWDREFTVYFSIVTAIIGLLLFCTACDVVLRYRSSGSVKPQNSTKLSSTACDEVLRNRASGSVKSVKPQNSTKLSWLAEFSLIKSASSILSTELGEHDIPVIHGIRILSMGWIILGHEYYSHSLIGANVNVLSTINWAASRKSLYIFIAPFAVDTFFTLSGFLTTYLFFKHMPKEKCFNIPKYYLHRYFRLTPAVIALTIFTVVFLPKIGSGPRWDLLYSIYGGSCREKWWANLLYVQNFVKQDNLCFEHLWYLAVDTQLFFITPMILYPLYKKPKMGLAILFALFLASLVVPGVIVGINKYAPFSYIQSKNPQTAIMNVFTEIYVMPYSRAGPWLVGIFLGFEVANNKRTLGKFGVLIGWLCAIGAFAFCTFGTRSFMVSSYEYNVIWESFFTAVARPIWAVGICWIIYASVHNCAGPISTVLSWRFFVPLKKLSYCIYLVHLVIQQMQQSALKTPNYFNDYYIWHDFLSNLIISIVVGFFFSLLFESPVRVLEKMLFGKKDESVDESKKNP